MNTRATNAVNDLFETLHSILNPMTSFSGNSVCGYYGDTPPDTITETGVETTTLSEYFSFVPCENQKLTVYWERSYREDEDRDDSQIEITKVLWHNTGKDEIPGSVDVTELLKCVMDLQDLL